MSGQPRAVSVKDGSAKEAEVLYRTSGASEGTAPLEHLVLDPFGVVVAKVK
jgi:hypothetical protein